MKIIITIFLTALYLTQADLLSKYKIIGQKKPPLKQILAEVESQIKSGGSLETTIAFLDNLKATIDDEQIRHDQLFTDQQNQCDRELELRKKDIADANQVLNRATEQLENCVASDNKAGGELENNLANQKATDADINLLSAIRNEGKRLFEIKKQDHIDALRSLQESVKILDGFQSGGISLAQMSEVSLNLITQSMKTKTMSQMAIISTIFAQMLSESGGYQEVYEKLKSLLTSLEQTLFKNLQKYQEEEDNSIQEYDDRHIHLIEYYNNLKRTETQLRDHISAMKKCQDQQSAIIESAKGKKIRNSQIFDSANKLCSDFRGEYEKATIVRKSEIDLVEQVKQTIIDRTQSYRGNSQF